MDRGHLEPDDRLRPHLAGLYHCYALRPAVDGVVVVDLGSAISGGSGSPALRWTVAASASAPSASSAATALRSPRTRRGCSEPASRSASLVSRMTSALLSVDVPREPRGKVGRAADSAARCWTTARSTVGCSCCSLRASAGPPVAGPRAQALPPARRPTSPDYARCPAEPGRRRGGVRHYRRLSGASYHRAPSRPRPRDWKAGSCDPAVGHQGLVAASRRRARWSRTRRTRAGAW